MNIVQKNIIDAKEQAIVHQYGENISLLILKKYPYAIENNISCDKIEIKGKNKEKKIINMYISDESSFLKCINQLSKIKNLKSVAFPFDKTYLKGIENFKNKNDIKIVIYKQPEQCFKCDYESVFCCECGKSYCVECGTNQGKFNENKFANCENCMVTAINNVPIPKGWEQFFKNNKSLLDEISKSISNDETVYPQLNDVFNAFNYCKLEDIKVVIIGQDCYHGNNQAMGLCFSVNSGVKVPPSLVNIFKELESDGFSISDKSNGDLSKWAKNGVFMYNTALTVRKSEPGSHIKIWKLFSEQVVRYINYNCDNVVFILWGGHAKSYKKMLKQEHHFIESVHPSPLSVYGGFFGSKPFSQTNEFLKNMNKKPIDWNL